MAYNVSDILITPAYLWFAPVGEAKPDETTVDVGDPWGGNWQALGYTLEPVTVAYNQDVFELEVQQLTNPVKRAITKEDIMIESVLAEFNPTNLALVFNGAASSTPAGPAQKAFDDIRSGGRVDLDEYSFGFEGLYKNQANAEFPVRVFIHRATATLNGEIAFAKNAGVGIPVQIKALADTSKPVGEQILQIHRVTGSATTS